MTDNKKKSKINKSINKGTGAGGANTNIFGKTFEVKTCMKENLINNNFKQIRINNNKYGYYLYRKIDDIKYIFVSQGGLKLYCKEKFGITLFRNPDEAYIIHHEDKITIKILEKKAQNCYGSVETKLWAGASLKREYEMVLGNKFIVDYAYCLNQYLYDIVKSDIQKYVVLMKILKEANIKIFCGESKKYYHKLKEWIKNF